jgi:hypothetical protein
LLKLKLLSRKPLHSDESSYLQARPRSQRPYANRPDGLVETYLLQLNLCRDLLNLQKPLHVFTTAWAQRPLTHRPQRRIHANGLRWRQRWWWWNLRDARRCMNQKQKK